MPSTQELYSKYQHICAELTGLLAFRTVDGRALSSFVDREWLKSHHSDIQQLNERVSSLSKIELNAFVFHEGIYLEQARNLEKAVIALYQDAGISSSIFQTLTEVFENYVRNYSIMVSEVSASKHQAMKQALAYFYLTLESIKVRLSWDLKASFSLLPLWETIENMLLENETQLSKYFVVSQKYLLKRLRQELDALFNGLDESGFSKDEIDYIHYIQCMFKDNDVFSELEPFYWLSALLKLKELKERAEKDKCSTISRLPNVASHHTVEPKQKAHLESIDHKKNIKRIETLRTSLITLEYEFRELREIVLALSLLGLLPTSRHQHILEVIQEIHEFLSDKEHISKGLYSSSIQAFEEEYFNKHSMLFEVKEGLRSYCQENLFINHDEKTYLDTTQLFYNHQVRARYLEAIVANLNKLAIIQAWLNVLNSADLEEVSSCEQWRIQATDMLYKMRLRCAAQYSDQQFSDEMLVFKRSNLSEQKIQAISSEHNGKTLTWFRYYLFNVFIKVAHILGLYSSQRGSVFAIEAERNVRQLMRATRYELPNIRRQRPLTQSIFRSQKQLFFTQNKDIDESNSMMSHTP